MTKTNNLVPKRRFQEFQNTNSWEQCELGKITNSYSGGTPSVGRSEYYDGDIPFIRSGEINSDSTELFISEKALNSSSAKMVEVGDILYAMYGATSGEAGISKINGAINQAILAIKPIEGYDSKFIMQLLRSQKHKILDKYLQGGQGNLSGSIVKGLQIKVPNYDEQNKIGRFFEELENNIIFQKRKLEKAQALKFAYLSELFPNEGDLEPKRRFAGFTGAWKQGTIGEFGYFYYGKSAPKWSVTSDATTPCVRYGELYTKHKEKIDTIYSFTNIPRENLKFSTGNEVLVPRVGEDPLDFANCSWLSIPGVAIGEMISVYNTQQNPLFTAYMFNALFKYEFAKRVEGGNVSNLYYTKLENIPVSYPSIEEQNKIASFLDNLSNLIVLHQRKLEKLQNLKKAYLNEMFI
ncbi:restriction endonuclease subunit S [Solibacillus sp. FSL R7-0682]|uniref:restriction endonuclease subunit S n=1 Tax=Solibacillus sp. FSL R7-0682 TaxID=2921690 RepID=UPI0030F4EC86